MAQTGFNTSCGSSSASSAPANIEYVDPSCSSNPVVKDKLQVVGKQAVIHITVDVWDTIGCADDNIVRVYKKGKCVYKDGLFYWSLEDGNVDAPPSAKWTRGYEDCELLNPELNITTAPGIDWAALPICV